MLVPHANALKWQWRFEGRLNLRLHDCFFPPQLDKLWEFIADSNWLRLAQSFSPWGISCFLFSVHRHMFSQPVQACDHTCNMWCMQTLNFGKQEVTSIFIRITSNHPTVHILALFEWHRQPWDWHRKTLCLPMVVATLNSRCKSGWWTGVVVLKLIG